MRVEWVGLSWLMVACAPRPTQTPHHEAPIPAEATPAPVEPKGVQALYGPDGRPLTEEAPETVVPLREQVTLVPTERERDFAGVGSAHPPRVGRRNVEVRGARLDNTLRMLAEHGRFNLVLPSPLAEPVNLRLRGVEPYDALLAVAQSHGLEVAYAGDVVTVTPQP